MKVRCFAEIPAGLGSVSLVLQGGKHCKPPVSRMGNKHGYSSVILDAMGLRPGQGAQSYLWCEADPDVRNLLIAYTRPALLRAVAEVLRGWKYEEPRALWGRLRDERKARKAALPLDQSVAEWMFLHHGSYCYKGIEAGIGRPDGNAGDGGFGVVRPSLDIVHDAAERLASGPGWPPVAVTSSAPSAAEVAGWLAYVVRTHPGGGGFLPAGSVRTSSHNGGDRYPPDAPASAVGRLASVDWPPTCITPRAPRAEEVAGWVLYTAQSLGTRPPVFGGPPKQVTAANLADRIDPSLPWPPTAITSRVPTAEEVAGWVALGEFSYRAGNPEVSTRPTEPTPGADLEGCVILMDPPYRNTTGYSHDMPREDVVRLATSYASAGAFVVVCEAEPVEELTALGWEAVDIGGERRGQKRTFGHTNEFITMSKPPVNRPGVQGRMFG